MKVEAKTTLMPVCYIIVYVIVKSRHTYDMMYMYTYEYKCILIIILFLIMQINPKDVLTLTDEEFKNLGIKNLKSVMLM